MDQPALLSDFAEGNVPGLTPDHHRQDQCHSGFISLPHCMEQDRTFSI